MQLLELMKGRELVLLRGLSRLHMYSPSGAYKNDARVREGLRAPPAGMLHHFQQQSGSLLWAHSLAGQLPRSLGVQDFWCQPPYPFREAQMLR